jgi:hypothetical protein
VDFSVVMLSVSTLAGATPVVAHTGCPGFDALNPICQVANLGGTVASAGADAVLSGLSQWVASGAEWLLSQIGDVLVSTTTIDIGAGWFRTHYGVMTALAGVVVLPLLLVSTLQAIYRQSASQLVKSFLVQLPLALLLGVVGVQIVVLSLSATDALSNAVAGGSGSDVKALLAGVTKGLILATGDPAMATFVLLLVGLLVAVAAFVLWLELLVRAAAVYVAVLFLPLALVTLVWPAVSHWCRRLVETLAALILSKFVIVATLSLAAGAIASGTAGTGHAGSGFASVLAGGALLVLSTFVPFAILRLIPMAEAGAIGHLDGVRQRSTAAVGRLPRSAATFALNGAMEAHGARKLAALAGPAGTGGAGASASSARAAGTGAAGAGGAGFGAGAMAPEEPNWANGGMIPDENGMMSGIPGAEDIAVAAMDARKTRRRGPRPLFDVPAGGGAVSEPHTPSPPGQRMHDGLPVIGLPGPNDRMYVMDRDEIGAVIRYVPGTGPKRTGSK